MSKEEEIKCPKCGSNNIGIESNSPTSFSDSMLGKFDYPLFYNYCFACGHRWYLSSRNEEEDDETKQEVKNRSSRSLFVALIMYIVPTILFLVIAFLIYTNVIK